MGMTQSLLFSYTYPDLKQSIDNLETQSIDDVFKSLNNLQNQQEIIVVCTILIEKAIKTSIFFTKHIELMLKFENEEFKKSLATVIETKLEKIIQNFKIEHLDDVEVYKRGYDIAVFSGTMFALEILSQNFKKNLFAKLKKHENEKSIFFRQKIQVMIDYYEKDIKKILPQLLSDEKRLQKFIFQPKSRLAWRIFNAEVEKAIKKFSTGISDLQEFSKLGQVLTKLFNKNLITAQLMDPWFDIARNNKSTTADFIIRLNEVARKLGPDVNWERASGLIHVPVEAQFAMNELLKLRDERKEIMMEIDDSLSPPVYPKPSKTDISSIFPEFQQLKQLTSAKGMNISAIKAVKVPNDPEAFRAVSEHLVDLIFTDIDLRHIRYMLMEIISVTVCPKMKFFEAFHEALFDRYGKMMNNKMSHEEGGKLLEFFVRICESRIVERLEMAKIYKIICDNVNVDPKFGFEFLMLHFNTTCHFLPSKNPLSKEILDILIEVSQTLLTGFNEHFIDVTIGLKMMATSQKAFQLVKLNQHMKELVANNQKIDRKLYAISGEYCNTGYDDESDWFITAE